jgi:transcriptional regulator with XRE-family HTH domain
VTPASLLSWMQRLHFTKKEAALSLGISRPTLDRYLNGDKPIPKTVALACSALAMGIPEHG